MLNQTQLDLIALRHEYGEGLEQIVTTLGLNVQAVLTELKTYHKSIIDEAKRKQRERAGV
jgi:hypothetical protein